MEIVDREPVDRDRSFAIPIFTRIFFYIHFGRERSSSRSEVSRASVTETVYVVQRSSSRDEVIVAKAVDFVNFGIPITRNSTYLL